MIFEGPLHSCLQMQLNPLINNLGHTLMIIVNKSKNNNL
jgi:hypothetical protein